MAGGIKNLLKEENPREKLICKGPEILTDVELLTILISTGSVEKSAIEIAREIMAKYTNFNELAKAEIQELLKIKSIGKAKASIIKAIGEISKRIDTMLPENSTEITKPQILFDSIKHSISDKENENLILVSLNSRNRIIAKDIISIGLTNETLIHPREIFRRALSRNAVSICLAHNHPSGDPTPSKEDILITEKIVMAGKYIGIPLIDHLIVSKNAYLSLKALNLIKN